MYKPKLLIHFLCRGKVWQLYADATVTCDGQHFDQLTKAGHLWIPKRETFFAMCRLWSNDWGLPGTIRKSAVRTAAIMREQIEEGIQE